MRRSPIRFPFTRWPWKSAAYLTIGAMLWFVTAFALASVVAIPYWAHGLATAERRMVRLAGFRPIPGRPAGAGLPALHEPRLWREVGFALTHMLFGVISFAGLITVTTLISAGGGAVLALAGVGTALTGDSDPLLLLLLGAGTAVAAPYVVTLLGTGRGVAAQA